MRTESAESFSPSSGGRRRDGGEESVETYGHGSKEDEEEAGRRGLTARYTYIFIRSIPRQLPVYPSLSTTVSPHSHGHISHTGPSIRQLSSIEAVRHRKVASDLAVKSRLRAAHDTLNPWLVDPETFNLDVTACCQEEISLYSSYVRAGAD